MDAQQIINAGRRRHREVQLAENVTVLVRILPGDLLEEAVSLSENTDIGAQLSGLAALFVVDDEGEQVFTPGQAAQLPYDWLQAISTAALEHNGLSPDAQRAMEGNLPGAGSAGSGSSSQAI